MVTNCVSIRF